MLRRPRVFRDRTVPLDAFSDNEMKNHCRLSRQIIMQIHDQIQVDIGPRTGWNKSVPDILQLFCAFRLYACGSFQHVVGDGLGLHRSTVNRNISRVSKAFLRLIKQHIRFPRELLLRCCSMAELLTPDLTCHWILPRQIKPHVPSVVPKIKPRSWEKPN